MDRDPLCPNILLTKRYEGKNGIVVGPKSEPTRQMVLGTDNQEKDPRFPWRLTPTAPELPGAPSLYPNMPPYPGAPPPQKPSWVCPLVETGGEFGPTWVHKLFSLLELKQIKQDLGSLTDDPGKYIDTFQHITLAFDLTWRTSWSYSVKLYLTLRILGSPKVCNGTSHVKW